MKFFIITALVLFSTHSFANPCNGAKGAPHKNPDGSVGGFVANTASVAASVVVDASSSVCDKAKVLGNSRITERSVVGGEALIEGQISIAGSKVRGAARVFGRAVVSGSTICQASQVNFNVTRSDYYCQTDDEEPNDPGELGKKTLLGIDSNNNGIRDDVEIWINRRFSNTPDKDFYNERMAMKQYAKAKQKIFKYINVESKVKEAVAEGFDAMDCLRGPVVKKDSFKNKEDFLKALDQSMKRLKEVSGIREELHLIVNNTQGRIKVGLDAMSIMHGESLISAKKTKDGCYFEKLSK